MAAKALKRGLFITFEGPEGCGKSTQTKLLTEYLTKRGYACVATREPGGTKTGELVRTVLLNASGACMTDLTELLLFEACRAQIVEEVIRPALGAGTIVICDRFSDSTLSYQGYGGDVPLTLIETVNRIATGGLQPDLTILLDIKTEEGLKRSKRKGVDRMELKTVAYHKRVRAGYLELANRYPQRIKVIEVTGPIDQTQAAVRHEVELAVQRHQRAG